MTQEEKQLLLKDISARLPYGLKLRYVEDLVVKKESRTITLNNIYLEHILNGDADIKPYLRPLSSMTEEEKKGLQKAFNIKSSVVGEYDISSNDAWWLKDKKEPLGFSAITYTAFSGVIDWLNEHHFDYRGLIHMGLALEAPEGMYKDIHTI